MAVWRSLRRGLAGCFSALLVVSGWGMAGVDTSLTAQEAASLLQSIDGERNFSGAALRIRKLALHFRPDATGAWNPVAGGEFSAAVDALRLLRARGHRIIGLVDVDFYPWSATRRGDRSNRLGLDLREMAGLARGMRQHLDDFVDAWEVGNEPEIFLRDNAEDYAAALKAFWIGYHSGQDTSPKARVVMAPLAHSPGPYLRNLIANDLLRHTEAYNFHLYGYAEDIGPFYDAHLRAVRELARAEAPGRRWWGRSQLPVFLTEVGYSGVLQEDTATPEARKRQAKWFSVVKHELLRRGPEVALAFVLKPYVSPTGREMGLVRSDGAGGYLATPALLGWLEPARHQSPTVPLRLPRFHAPPRIVIDFLPGAGLKKLTDKTGYEVAAAGATGTVVLYNFAEVVREVSLQLPVSFSFAAETGTVLTLTPGERRELPVQILAPGAQVAAAIELTVRGGKRQTAHWSTFLRPRYVSGAEPLHTLAFSADENVRVRQRIESAPRPAEEPRLRGLGRWLVTDGVEVEETATEWRITLRRMPPEAGARRAVAELPLPQALSPTERSRLVLSLATEKGARTEIEMKWRTPDQALFGRPYWVVDDARRLYHFDLIDNHQSFHTRVAQEWRIERQQFASLVLALRPLTPLPLTLVVQRPHVVRTERN